MLHNNANCAWGKRTRWRSTARLRGAMRGGGRAPPQQHTTDRVIRLPATTTHRLDLCHVYSLRCGTQHGGVRQTPRPLGPYDSTSPTDSETPFQFSPVAHPGGVTPMDSPHHHSLSMTLALPSKCSACACSKRCMPNLLGA